MAKQLTPSQQKGLDAMSKLFYSEADLETRQALLSALNAYSNHIYNGTKTELKNEPKQATTLF